MKFSLVLTFFVMNTALFSQAEKSYLSLLQNPKFKIEHIHYRQATWETEALQEGPYAWPNNGGYVFVYFTNISDEPQRIRNWVMNREEGSRMRLGYKIAWDRLFAENLAPGQTSVLEICGVSDDFQPGKPFEFAFIGGNWRPSAAIRTTLQEEPVQISFIHLQTGLKDVEIFVRNNGDRSIECQDINIIGQEIVSAEWAEKNVPASGNTITRLRLKEALTPGELLIVQLAVHDTNGERSIFAHRRAHEDFFPIGTWGANKDHFQFIRQHHVDTIVKGGQSDDEFYSQDAKRFGFRTMVHTAVYPSVDVLRDLGDHPAVAAWMVQDEPDWNRTPQQIFTSVEMTHQYNSSKPTMITLCRNGKFFEFAFLPDIACQDHYSVTAPTSSIWPYRYGTRLEETAYYTRDLKCAAEPKPIWVWSQGLANWDERPIRPVPTPDELAAQLLFNLGRGAKGLLWFTFNVEIGEKYPEMLGVMQGWGRVLHLLRETLLTAEPVNAHVQAPEKLDIAVLASWEKLLIFVVNTDYEIHDESYPWRVKKDVTLELTPPSWIQPRSACVISPDGVQDIEMRGNHNIQLNVGDVQVGKIIVLDNRRDITFYQQLYDQTRLLESKTY